MQCHAPICVVGDLVSYFQTAAATATTPAQQAADFDPFKSLEVSATERERVRERRVAPASASTTTATATSQTLQ